MKKILVPCDFSQQAQEALQFAVNLATAQQGEIQVMQAIDFPLMADSEFSARPYVIDPELIQELEDNAFENFDKLKTKFPDVPIGFHVMHGPVTASIRTFIKEQGIDLVVMGTLGSSGLEEYLIGSNTEKVVRFSPVPVIAVRHARALSDIHNIVLPTTLELDQMDFMNKVKELQSFFNARLHVLYVNTPVHFQRDQNIHGLMEDFVKHYGLTNYTLNSRNDPYEQDGIIQFTQEVQGDMIAMATHSRRGLLHLFSGSIAEDVVNHIDCPIWTYTLRKNKS